MLSRASTIPFACAALLAAALDLVTKALAVNDPNLFGPGVYFNPDIPHLGVRALVCIGTVVVVALLSMFARRRGVGSITVVWIAAGVLVGAVFAQGLSGEIWSRGVPDFIWGQHRVWNVADFSIALGLLLFLVSAIAYPVRAFVRSWLSRHRAT